MEKRQKLVRLTLGALFTAIIVVMTFVPYLGYITIPGMLSITTIHLPVLIGIILLRSPLYGLYIGGVWGVSCILYALFNGTADAAIFLNPLISVLPRILVGLLTALFYQAGRLLCKFRAAGAVLSAVMQLIVVIFVFLLVNNIAGNLYFAIAAAAAVYFVSSVLLLLFAKWVTDMDVVPVLFACVLGTFSNTALVLSAIQLFGKTGFVQLTGLVGNIFSTVVALNGSIEMVTTILIAVPCALGLTRAFGLRGKRGGEHKEVS